MGTNNAVRIPLIEYCAKVMRANFNKFQWISTKSGKKSEFSKETKLEQIAHRFSRPLEKLLNFSLSVLKFHANFRWAIRIFKRSFAYLLMMHDVLFWSFEILSFSREAFKQNSCVPCNNWWSHKHGKLCCFYLIRFSIAIITQ